MKKNYSKGFTLIELLVVIAIIGILASVILASLNSARAKGADAAIKSGMANAHTQAELYYDNNNNSYLGVCAASGSATPAGINTILSQAATTAGSGALITTLATGETVSGPGSAVCHDAANGTAYAAQMPLKGGGYWCIDSLGTVKAEPSNNLPGGATKCS